LPLKRDGEKANLKKIRLLIDGESSMEPTKLILRYKSCAALTDLTELSYSLIYNVIDNM